MYECNKKRYLQKPTNKKAENILALEQRETV